MSVLTPQSIFALGGRWKASEGNTLDTATGGVSSVADLTAAGLPALQADATKMPQKVNAGSRGRPPHWLFENAQPRSGQNTRNLRVQGLSINSRAGGVYMIVEGIAGIGSVTNAILASLGVAGSGLTDATADKLWVYQTLPNQWHWSDSRNSFGGSNSVLTGVPLEESGPCVLTFAFEAAAVKIYVNNQVLTRATAMPAFTFTDLAIGADLTAVSNGLSGRIYEFGAIKTSAPTATQVGALVDFGRGEYDVRDAWDREVHFFGDSISRFRMAGEFGGWNDPRGLDLPRGTRVVNCAVNGRTLSDINSAAGIAGGYANDFAAAAATFSADTVGMPRVAVIFAATNDLTGQASGYAVATALPALSTACAAARTAGFTHVVVCPTLPRNSVLQSEFTAFNAGIESLHPTWADRISVIPWHKDSILGTYATASNAFYMNDATHPEAVLTARMQRYASPVILNALGVQPGMRWPS